MSVKGLGQFRTLTDSNNIMNSSYGLDDMGGLVLYHSDKNIMQVNGMISYYKGNKEFYRADTLEKTKRKQKCR